MNRAGERTDGPPVLAIWAGRTLWSSGRGRHEGRVHSHLRGQLLCIEDGLMQVRTPQGSWLVPPQRAVWVPPGHDHAATITGVTRSWNIFLSPRAARAMPAEPCVIAVNTLMQALVLRASAWTDARLLFALEEVVEKELDRHLRVAKDWMPHEYVPWSDGRNFPGLFEDGEASTGVPACCSGGRQRVSVGSVAPALASIPEKSICTVRSLRSRTACNEKLPCTSPTVWAAAMAAAI